MQRPQHKSTSDSLGAPKTNNFGAIFLEFGDTKKCHTFGGLELVPKREFAVSAAGTKVKMHSNPLGPSKKFLLLKTTKNARYVRSLGEKPHFFAYTEAKKGVSSGRVR